MTVLDIFVAVIVVASVLGLIMLTLSYVAITGITFVSNATANLPTYTPTSLASSLQSTALFLPDIAVILIIVLIVFSWMLSAFIKSNPLAVVISISWLIFYTVVAFFMAHYMISTIDATSIFASLGSSPNILYLFWANMPIILLVSSIVDITIAVLAYRSS